ncbi:MAG: radical SAM protein [Polyangiales bacterium]
MDVSLVLTHDCNLGCGYCYTGAKFRKRMSRETASKGLDLAFGDHASEIQLSYFGGEPTLELDLLIDVAKEARERAAKLGKKLVQTVTTNGTLLDAKKVAALYELDIYLALSIDGVKEAHDGNRPQMGGGSSFEAVERALHLLVEAGRSFETISVVTPLSARFLGESIAWLFEAGVPRVSLNPCYEAAWDDESLEAWEKGLKSGADTMKSWMRKGRTVSVSVFDNKILAALKGGLGGEDKCKLGDGFVAVSPEGHLYGCERNVAEDDRPELRVGHVDTGVEMQRVCSLRPDVHEDKHATNEECNTCAEKPRCSASCACANMAETGSMQVAGGVQCWHERTVARIADEMAEELFSELDPVFLRWFYGRMGVDPELLAREIRAGRIQIPKRTSDAASVGMVARRKTQDGKRALPLVR